MIISVILNKSSKHNNHLLPDKTSAKRRVLKLEMNVF